ncbi:peroxiredoxin-like family protein [Mycobacterium sp. 1245805.9]|uniref:peroxiredoxin-like family protein n=1 Tax=Mycobacterium sp. 1245805.9 TaxID=1856862 RepID=UPI0009EDCA46|nr:peroxiredoxin-like family protein [Mycobacterium sp. 1245805.9]
MSLAVGTKFPTKIAVDTPNGPLALSTLLSTGPLVVAFHRLWCPFCQQAARELASVKHQLDAAGAHVVIVYREDVETTARACAERAIPFSCVSDSDRELETATDIQKFSIARYAAFSPGKLIHALRSGSRVGKVNSEFLQGRGTFVVDRDARIVYAHQSRTAADIAPIEEILAAVASTSQAGTRDRSGT